MFPEISAADLGAKLRSDETFILLDVREPEELEAARIDDPRLVPLPMSRLAAAGLRALPENVRSGDGPVFILCHHGSRSMQVTLWLMKQGFQNVVNVSGGIDAYAREVDPSVGSY